MKHSSAMKEPTSCTTLNIGAVTMTGIDCDRDGYVRLLRNVQERDVGEGTVRVGARRWGGRRRGADRQRTFGTDSERQFSTFVIRNLLLN